MPAPAPFPVRSKQIITTVIDTPLGPLTAGASNEGVCLLEFAGPRSDMQTIKLALLLTTELTPGRHRFLDQLRSELADYFVGGLSRFTVPITIRGTPFQ